MVLLCHSVNIVWDDYVYRAVLGNNPASRCGDIKNMHSRRHDGTRRHGHTVESKYSLP